MVRLLVCGVAATSALLASQVAAPPAAAARPTTCAWKTVKAPQPGQSDRYLQDVYVLGKNDVWAVGTYDFAYPLALHWNGRTWKRFSVPLPTAPNRYAQLRSVWGAGRENVWAVGTDYAAGDIDASYIAHWNGTAWSLSPHPDGTFEDVLYGVHGSGASNVWAVGYQNGQTGDGNRNWALRWNGTSWSEAMVPNYSTSFRTMDLLEGVYARSATDAWTVGTFFAYDPMSTNQLPDRATFNHFTGATWGASQEKNKNALSNKVHAVDGAAGTVWAVGEYATATSVKPLLLRLGASPSIATPPAFRKAAHLDDVYVAGASRAWAVGDLGAPGAPNARKTLVLHRTRAGWKRVPSPNVAGKAYNTLTGIDGVSDSNVWAVGKAGPGQFSSAKAVILHYTCA